MYEGDKCRVMLAPPPQLFHSLRCEGHGGVRGVPFGKEAAYQLRASAGSAPAPDRCGAGRSEGSSFALGEVGTETAMEAHRDDSCGDNSRPAFRKVWEPLDSAGSGNGGVQAVNVCTGRGFA